jgi:exopolyphosphatase/pppGpp-phosphohydrolase
MEQKDYILREIEKISFLLKMFFNKIAGKEVFDLFIDTHFEEEKEILLHEIGFDMDVFLTLKNTEIEAYLDKFHGINCSNIEILADILKTMGEKSKSEKLNEYSTRALELYELCNLMDRTFSFDREKKISEIRNDLQ